MKMQLTTTTTTTTTIITIDEETAKENETNTHAANERTYESSQ